MKSDWSAAELACEGLPVTLELSMVGGGLLAVLSGGSRPHIGTAVMALPRPSLADPSRISSTSSVLNVPGHKDEAVCRMAAERLCARFGVVTVCTGGIHQDHITPDGLSAVMEAAGRLVERAVREFSP